jgi:hypothetical protein
MFEPGEHEEAPEKIRQHRREDERPEGHPRRKTLGTKADGKMANEHRASLSVGAIA